MQHEPLSSGNCIEEPLLLWQLHFLVEKLKLLLFLIPQHGEQLKYELKDLSARTCIVDVNMEGGTGFLQVVLSLSCLICCLLLCDRALVRVCPSMMPTTCFPNSVKPTTTSTFKR